MAMTPQIAMTALCVIETGLWFLIGFLFLRRSLQKRFPAMGWYIALQVLTQPLLASLLYLRRPPSLRYYAMLYFIFYWLVYVFRSVNLFFICMDVFRSVAAGNSELRRLGKVPFRWFAIILIIGILSSTSFIPRNIILSLCAGLMRSASIVSICLLVFLFHSLQRRHSSARDPSFGICLGFAWQSINDLASSYWVNVYHSSVFDHSQFIYESVILAGMCIWVVYFALPERVPTPLLSQADELDGAMPQLQQ